VSAQNALLVDLQGTPANNTNVFLYNGKLTVTLAGASGNPGRVTEGAAEALVNGYEVTVAIPTGENFAVNQYHVNQAIKAAINDNAVMSKLLVAEDGPMNTLVIKSLIDGEFTATDLKIDIEQPLAVNDPVAAAVVTAYQKFTHDSGADAGDVITANLASAVTLNAVDGIDVPKLAQFQFLDNNNNLITADYTGQDAIGMTDNTIELGLGDDVVVLSSNLAEDLTPEAYFASSETLVFKGYGLGKDTVVNFVDSTGPAGAIDKLDFTSYLTGKESSSGSVTSQTTIDVTLNDPVGAVEANSVTVLDSIDFTPTDTFAGLTAAKLLAALNTTTSYANIVDGTLDAENNYGADALVGGVGKAVVLIENDENEGEYAMFELTFNGAHATETDFTAAQLIGVVDFGATITLDAAQLIGS